MINERNADKQTKSRLKIYETRMENEFYRFDVFFTMSF